jgi:hypothetical protein
MIFLVDLLKISLLYSFYRFEFDLQVMGMAFAEIREEDFPELKLCMEWKLLSMQRVMQGLPLKIFY